MAKMPVTLLLGWGLSALTCPAWGERDVLIENAKGFLMAQQQADGSFGRPQPRLRTALVMLALLSLEGAPAETEAKVLEQATGFLLQGSSSLGDLGDDVFVTESHAIVLTAFLCVHEHLRSQDLRVKLVEPISRGLQQLLRLQDRGSAAASQGGWKMEGRRGQVNDRRASGWALLALHAARIYGLDVPEASTERGIRFLLGSFKETSENPDQVGGFSVDTLGLAVELISASGGWALSRFGGKPDARQKNLDWLSRHPPEWCGPNYFYSAFFRLRVLKFAPSSERLLSETRQRLRTQIADHQQSDGSVGFPPGNAQNTILMGPVFSTAMSVLILNAEDSRLPFDEVYVPRPRF